MRLMFVFCISLLIVNLSGCYGDLTTNESLVLQQQNIDTPLQISNLGNNENDKFTVIKHPSKLEPSSVWEVVVRRKSDGVLFRVLTDKARFDDGAWKYKPGDLVEVMRIDYTQSGVRHYNYFFTIVDRDELASVP